MKTVSFKPEHAGSILNAWNQSMGSILPIPQRLFQQNTTDEQSFCPKSSFTAVENGEVVGAVIAKRWPGETLGYHPGGDVGWINFLFVKEGWRGKGIGGQLLKEAEESLREQGCTTIHLGRDVQHFFPGIPLELTESIEWFKGKGYQSGEVVFDMIQMVEECEIELSVSVEPGLQIKRGQSGDEPALILFLQEAFPGRWEYEVRSLFERGGTAQQFVLIWQGDRVRGFCRINRPDDAVIGSNVYWSELYKGKAVGGIGPLGVSSQVRKNGLGLKIVKQAMKELKEDGGDVWMIDWTTLESFYNKLGFKKWKQYLQMSK
ncbi:GNAT family N-acetyltransferase [Sutcliffiella horikoshii]|uniref:GNAT family N-acetyltransferase n=1 Tax=Sutcliffiella horikoshii TaxID=79883 RepID=UPI00384AC1D8